MGHTGVTYTILILDFSFIIENSFCCLTQSDIDYIVRIIHAEQENESLVEVLNENEVHQQIVQDFIDFISNVTKDESYVLNNTLAILPMFKKDITDPFARTGMSYNLGKLLQYGNIATLYKIEAAFTALSKLRFPVE